MTELLAWINYVKEPCKFKYLRHHKGFVSGYSTWKKPYRERHCVLSNFISFPSLKSSNCTHVHTNKHIYTHMYTYATVISFINIGYYPSYCFNNYCYYDYLCYYHCFYYWYSLIDLYWHISYSFSFRCVMHEPIGSAWYISWDVTTWRSKLALIFMTNSWVLKVIVTC